MKPSLSGENVNQLDVLTLVAIRDLTVPSSRWA